MKTKQDIIDLLESLDFLSKYKKDSYIRQLDSFDESGLDNLYDFFSTRQEEYFYKLNTIIDKYKNKQLDIEAAELEKKNKEETERELDNIRKRIKDID